MVKFLTTIYIVMDKIVLSREFYAPVPRDYRGTKGLRFRITAVLHDLGQGPYCSLTGEIYRPGANDIEAGGCLHDYARETCPAVTPYLPWHLFSLKSGPMHYCANAVYWAGFSGFCRGGDNDPPNLQHLASTVAWGVLPGEDTIAPLEALLCPEVLRTEGISILLKHHERCVALETLLEARLPALKARFAASMSELFGAEAWRDCCGQYGLDPATL